MPKKFSKLTRPNVRHLKAGDSTNEHGITFERLSNGDGRYSVNIMVDGRRIHRVIGLESDGVTREQAEEFITNARTDARRGRLQLAKGRKLTLGFREAAEKYLENLVREGGKNIANKRRRLTMHVTPFFRDQPLAKIATFDVERYKKARGAAGAAAGTINRELAALSHLLNKAVEWGWIEHRPCRIKRLTEDSGRITYLTQEQAQRLLEAAKADACPHVYPFVLIGLDTCMRHMEILSIRVEHIDLNRRVIYIAQAKAGSREQPITQRVADLLRGMLQQATPGQEWLFPSPNSRSGHLTGIRKPFRRIVEAAGMDPDKVVRHTLRHTGITHLVQAGVDLPTVQRVSGHRTLAMVAKYAHQNGAHIEAAMDLLENRYKSAPGPAFPGTITQELHILADAPVDGSQKKSRKAS